MALSTEKDLYLDRKLSEGYPDLDTMAHQRYAARLEQRAEDAGRTTRIARLLGRVVPMEPSQKIVVIGCGPRPTTIKVLRDLGHHVTGVEPVESYVETGNRHLGAKNTIVVGAAESVPLPDQSQDVVFFQSVLEHVDSPSQSIEELYRILKPGGVLYLGTTNRFRIGVNGEYNAWLYNWLPPLVKESFIFRHLHYQPRLANYTTRPAVHWFCYSDLCRLGREAGFAHFYSLWDLKRPEDHPGSNLKDVLHRLLIGEVRRSVWIRSLLLTQHGGVIVMWKRR